MKKEEQIKMLLHPEEYDESQIDQMLDEARNGSASKARRLQRAMGNLHSLKWQLCLWVF